MTRLVFRDGEYLPYSAVTVGIGTHALHYGTNVFEGLRAYWDDGREELHLFRAPEHFARLHRSARYLGLTVPHSVDDLCAVTAQLLARSGEREDIYVRPLLFIDSEVIGLWRRGLTQSFVIFHTPMGRYIPEEGVRCGVSPWRRPLGNAAPARAKIGGVYASLAIARRDAVEAGFDEAIMLSADGHVAEGSAENIFLVIDGRLVTPSLGSDVLAGITRATVIELARKELAVDVVERDVNVAELGFADEVFLTGTAAEVTPVVEVDRRPVADGAPGPLTLRLASLYGDATHARLPAYAGWCLPVYGSSGISPHDVEPPAEEPQGETLR
jgi:branched-chain amino acid aminotransferase